MHKCAGIHASWVKCLPLSFLSYSFWVKISPSTWSSYFLAWLELSKIWSSPISNPNQWWSYRCVWDHTWLLCAFWDPNNSGLHAWAASTPNHWVISPVPQHHSCKIHACCDVTGTCSLALLYSISCMATIYLPILLLMGRSWALFLLCILWMVFAIFLIYNDILISSVILLNNVFWSYSKPSPNSFQIHPASLPIKLCVLSLLFLYPPSHSWVRRHPLEDGDTLKTP